jgi:hypothetical protein
MKKKSLYNGPFKVKVKEFYLNLKSVHEATYKISFEEHLESTLHKNHIKTKHANI